MTSVDKRLIHRNAWWPEYIVPAAVFGVGWAMKSNPYVTIGVALAAVVVVRLVKPRSPWTECQSCRHPAVVPRTHPPRSDRGADVSP